MFIFEWCIYLHKVVWTTTKITQTTPTGHRAICSRSVILARQTNWADCAVYLGWSVQQEQGHIICEHNGIVVLRVSINLSHS